MSRRLVIVAWLLGAVVIVAGTIVVRTMSAAGQFTTIKPIGTQGCRAIAGIVGAEDIVVDRAAGIAYVSSTDRLAIETGRGAGVRGEIFVLDLNRGDAVQPQPATVGKPPEFRPHGLSLLNDGGGVKRLFAVNHRADGRNTIERWDIDADGLKLVSPGIEHPLIRSPNDIAAVGPDRFYVTNDGGSGFARVVDFVLQRRRANVVYYDGKTARVVAPQLGLANGINVSADGRTVYVADTFRRTLEIFDRDVASGDLKPSGSVFFGTGLDNIDVDPDDVLWIAAHPRLIDFIRYISGGLKVSPSQIIRAVPVKGGGREARTVMLDLGETVPAASVAVRYRDRYLVGSVAGPNVVACDFKPAAG